MVGDVIERIVQTAIEEWTILSQEFITDRSVIGYDLLLDKEDVGDLADHLQAQTGFRFSDKFDVVTLLSYTVGELKSMVVSSALGIK